jgi:hypothetical protein
MLLMMRRENSWALGFSASFRLRALGFFTDNKYRQIPSIINKNHQHHLYCRIHPDPVPNLLLIIRKEWRIQTMLHVQLFMELLHFI